MSACWLTVSPAVDPVTELPFKTQSGLFSGRLGSRFLIQGFLCAEVLPVLPPFLFPFCLSDFVMSEQTSLFWRNPHVNTILANNGPRKWLTKRRARAFTEAAQSVILACGDGVRLHGSYNPAGEEGAGTRGLVILIHGWEGTDQSTYLLSAALRLHAEGYSIFRLHMRDHGPSLHLNRAPFLAVHLAEILDGHDQVARLFPHDPIYLVGYSLGGNLAVRVAAHASERALNLRKVVSVCPATDPMAVAEAIEGSVLYNGYFMRKWQKAFAQKIELFEEHRVNAHLLTHRRLIAMHDAFMPLYSDYPDARSYFAAYALSADNLERMDVPCQIILVEDDPVIPVETAASLPRLDGLDVEIVPHGGHCGCVRSWRLDSWLDARLVEEFAGS